MKKDGFNKNGKIEFEIINGIGKGKEYDIDGKLKFEGEYYNGERNGDGKEYHYNGELRFEGEYIKGKKWNGNVKEYYSYIN